MREKESWKERRKRTIYLDEKKTRREKKMRSYFRREKGLKVISLKVKEYF